MTGRMRMRADTARKMKNGIFRRLSVFALLAALLLCAAMFLGGCGQSDDEPTSETYVYYLDEDAGELLIERFTPRGQNAEEKARSYIDRIMAGPGTGPGQPLLPEGVTIDNMVLRQNIVSLFFPESYYTMDKTREVLARAGIVRSLVQVEGITRVDFFVGDAPLMDENGKIVGQMRRETFIDNSAQQINNYERDSVKLYFASEDGTGLVEESRAVYHSSSQSLEWAVVARLIAGPKSKGRYRMIPAETEILSVSTVNEICYVNFNSSFLSGQLALDDIISVRAIVNSLVESCGVKQVQIAVEGDTKVTMRGGLRLDQLFEEDLSLVRSVD